MTRSRSSAASDVYKRQFSDYLAARHGEVAKWIRLVSSSTIVFFFFLYVGAQFLGGGKTLDTMFGIKPQWGMLITALIIIPYTIYGGFQSVVYTDVVQALVMIFTLTVGPIVGFFYLANHPEVYSSSITIALESASPTHACLLYTSDAADDLLCVDLGGRRIIKKKKQTN